MVLNAENVAKIIALVDDGRSQRYAARALGIPETTVRRAIERYRETGLMTRRPGSGRPRATQPADDRFIQLQTLRNRFQTASETARRLQHARNTRVSVNTVRRRLAELDLHSRIPATGPQLTQAQREYRLRFAREHVAWTEEDWGRVLFSDESRFALYTSDRRDRVWRRPRERYARATMVEAVPYGGGSVMVWGGINLRAKTDLHVFPRGSLTAQRYIADVLQEYVVPFAPFIGENFLFMQDNARPHVANVVMDYLSEVDIRTLEWPPRSPDLNPIEHVWDMLGRRIRQRQHPPLDLQHLAAALVEEWDDITQESVATIIRSMRRRLEAVIEASGGNTRY